MPYYVATERIETSRRRQNGRERIFTRPRGCDQRGASWITLGGGLALVYLPQHDAHPALEQFAAERTETLSTDASRLLATKLAVRNPEQLRFDEVVAELMMQPTARWGVLRPSKRRQRYEILLGPKGDKLLWSLAAKVAPSTVRYTDDFTGDGNMDGRTFSGGTAAWDEIDGTVWATAGGAGTATNIPNASGNTASTTVDVDSDDYDVLCDLTVFARANSTYLAFSQQIRGNQDGTVAGYAAELGVNTSNAITNILYNWDTDAELDTDTSGNPETGLPKEFKVEADGSSLTVEFGGAEIMSATDTAFTGGTGNRRARVFAFSADSSLNDIEFDNFETGDLVALVATAALTGTATASIDEADIVAGGKTIILTLSGDSWVA